MAMTTTQQTCEICGYALPDDPFESCVCATRQSPEFYVYDDSDALFRIGDFCVARVGEMRIVVSDPDDPNCNQVLNHTDDLIRYGITTDAELNTACAEEEHFYLDHNPWFEVIRDGTDEFSDPIYDLDEAVSVAIQWHDSEEETKGI